MLLVAYGYKEQRSIKNRKGKQNLQVFSTQGACFLYLWGHVDRVIASFVSGFS